MFRSGLRISWGLAALLASFLFLPAGTCPAGAAEPANRPNVLFLAIDDLNDWVGVLDGYPGVKTPNLDRLARRGVLFTRAYCAAPACNPSRAALMCGIRPSTSGVYHNSQPWRPAMPDAVTLAQYFMANGYRVEGGGKIFHGAYPDPASWHHYVKRSGDPMPRKRPLNGIPNTAHFDWGPVQAADKDMGDDKIAHWACDFLSKEHDKPFFLAAGMFRPHLPWYVPPKYFKEYPLDKIVLPKVPDDDLDDIPPLGKRIARPEGDHRKVLASHNWEKAVQGYLASITFSDRCIGMILDALDRSQYARNTLIVLWSDHGWHLGEKHHWRKFALWEEATRVPLIFVVPGVTKANQRCERTVNLMDIYPTLVELCGLEEKKGLEGVSLVPLLRDPRARWDRPSVTTHGRNNHSVRDERWRYIRYSDGTEELYDHDKDPMEWVNVASRPENAEVKKRLAAWLPRTNAPDAKSRPRRQRRKARP
jgi:arylsulfatase A-like enzyme